MGLMDVMMVRAGDEFVCALRQTGTVTCWGIGTSGQLGDGTATTRRLPNRDIFGLP